MIKYFGEYATINTLEKELATLKRNRTRGGLVCRCM